MVDSCVASVSFMSAYYGLITAVLFCVSLEREVWCFPLVIPNTMECNMRLRKVCPQCNPHEEVSLWVWTCLLIIMSKYCAEGLALQCFSLLYLMFDELFESECLMTAVC